MLPRRLAVLSPRARWSPSLLFKSNEQGAWYDPSDLSTLYQDSAGITPVTAPGQTVGMALDKSKGLVRGPELITNGGFDSATGWTPGAGWTIAAGKAAFSNATGTSLTTTGMTMLAGRTYEISFDLDYVSGAGITGGLSGGGGSDNFPTLNTSGRKQTLVRASIDRTTLGFTGVGGSVVSIDNVSVKELRGNHASQSVAASRPIYQVDASGRGYLSFDGVDDFLATGSVDFTTTDKILVLAGAAKLAENNSGTVVELSGGADSNPGAFYLRASAGGAANWQFLVRSATGNASPTPVGVAPDTTVLTLSADLGAPRTVARRNGSGFSDNVSPAGGGNFGNYPLYVGRRGGSSLPFNGRLYGLVLRGAATDLAGIQQTEAWLNQRTGAY